MVRADVLGKLGLAQLPEAVAKLIGSPAVGASDDRGYGG
jgi:hypothetical protein